MKTLFCLSVVLLVLATAKSDEEACTNGKVFNACGTSCPATCANKDNPPLVCNLMCNVGCFCPKGYYEYEDGCVTADECPDTATTTSNIPTTTTTSNVPTETMPPKPTCTGSKIYKECGSACPATCKNKGTLVMCPAVCVSGCFCPTGMYEHEGQCVTEDNCPVTDVNPSPTPSIPDTPSPDPPACTNGKQYTTCGSACPVTCKNKDNPPSCIDMCVKGCFCPSGMVLSEKSCVQPDDCLSLTKPEYCQLSFDAGLCKGYFPKFFFNSTSKQCEQFIYGGCGGNDNNFDTKDSCTDACADNILLAKHKYNPQQMCPKVDSDTMGTCAEECISHSSCDDDDMCCSNGCGHSCTVPVSVPYYDPPLQCPTNTKSMICSELSTCSSHNDCSTGNYCCSVGGCGHVCVSPETKSPSCTAIKQSVESEGLIGAYVPQCEKDGTFSPVQSHGSTGMFWCVDTSTGKPQSPPTMFAMPECEEDKCKLIMCDWPYCGEDVQPITIEGECCPTCPAECVVEGVTYTSGSSYTAPDGCNKCTCYNGMSACTEMACIPTSCEAGGIELNDGEIKKDGCSECVCRSGRISCTVNATSCNNPINRRYEITMKFNGDFDTISNDMEGFKITFKTTLITKYSTFRLHESQISNILVSRGSVIVTFTLEDGQDDSTVTTANVTILVVHIEQDYNDNNLVIQHEDSTLEPAGEFSYDDNDDDDGYCLLPLIALLAGLVASVVCLFFAIVVAFTVIKKRRSKRMIKKVPTKEDHELVVQVKKGFSNPTFLKLDEKI